MGGIRRLIVVASVGAMCVLEGASTLAAQATTPKYTNAEVITIKAQERLLVVRTNEGTEQTLELDDQLVGFGDLLPGDRVILTLRGEPGRARIEAFSKAAPPPARTTTVDTAKPLPESSTEEGRAQDAFEQRVTTLAQQASRVDTLWNGFRTSCNVTLRGGDYEGAREWLSLWDNQAQVDLSSGTCRDLFNQIVGLGQAVNTGMASAHDAARSSLEPGQIREIQKRTRSTGRGGAAKPQSFAIPSRGTATERSGAVMTKERVRQLCDGEELVLCEEMAPSSLELVDADPRAGTVERRHLALVEHRPEAARSRPGRATTLLAAPVR